MDPIDTTADAAGAAGDGAAPAAAEPITEPVEIAPDAAEAAPDRTDETMPTADATGAGTAAQAPAHGDGPEAMTATEAAEPQAAEPQAAEPEAAEPAEPAPAEPAPAETETAPVAEAGDAARELVPDDTADAGGDAPDEPGAEPAVVAEGSEPAVGDPATTPQVTATGLHSGQIVDGRVVSVSADEAVLELADGSTGVISKRHLTANGQLDPTELLAVGDGVEAAVLIRDDPKGRIVLSRAWALKQRAWEQVEAAKAAHRPITGRVTGQVKGGLVVDVGTRAFLPASQVDLHHVDDLTAFVGQDIEALVQEADRANDKIVLSRRNLLRSAQRSKANEFAATLAAGQVHRGRVSLLTDFGAFVEIGGVRGLVHLSELSWSRVERADEVVTPGTEVEVKVLAVKPGKKLSLSIRALTPDPLTTLQPGQILPGIVTRLADFGAFVRVGDGAEGLVHVTELAEYRVHAPEEVVTPGDEVLVKVLRIDRKRRRLDLSVNQALLS